MYKLCVLNNRKEQLLNKEKSTSLDGLVKSPARKLKRSNTIGSPRHTKMSKLNMGEARDDVHVCIMCLRAIMNHQVSLQPIKLCSSCCMVHNQESKASSELVKFVSLDCKLLFEFINILLRILFS